jgi:gluconokinase
MIVVMMGVCGTGKTSVGKIVASRMGWTFIEGDDLHPVANREKMASGTPLTDADRWPWLDRITDRMRALDQAGQSAVVACSALRQAYRDRLRLSGARVIFLHLTGDASVIRQRMESRSGHYMPPGLLDSQLATLEPALPGETLHQIDISGTVEGITEAAIRSLSGGTAPAG